MVHPGRCYGDTCNNPQTSRDWRNPSSSLGVAMTRPHRRLGEQVEIKRIVAILEEHRLAPVPPLRHAVRDAWQDDAGKTRHALTPSRHRT
jgi:hypothetical protein